MSDKVVGLKPEFAPPEQETGPPLAAITLFSSVHEMAVALIMASGRSRLHINSAILHHAPEHSLDIQADEKGVSIGLVKKPAPTA